MEPWANTPYWTNDAYREKKKERERKRNSRFRQHPTFRRLDRVRNLISHRRYAIERLLKRVQKYENELLTLISERDRLVEEWRSVERQQKPFGIM